MYGLTLTLILNNGKKLYFNVLIEYKIDKTSLKHLIDITNNNDDDIDWEQEFINGTLTVIDVLGF